MKNFYAVQVIHSDGSRSVFPVLSLSMAKTFLHIFEGSGKGNILVSTEPFEEVHE